MRRNSLLALLATAAVPLTGCSAQPAAVPAQWAAYDTLAALRSDSTTVVEGVAQRITRDGDDRQVQFSVTDPLAGLAPTWDPIWIEMEPDTPLDLQPGTHYVLYLTHDPSDSTFKVVGPGAFERPLGDTAFRPPQQAPDTLPVTVTTDELREG